MSMTDKFLANNTAFASAFVAGDRVLSPAPKVAIVACMDSRLDPRASSV